LPNGIFKIFGDNIFLHSDFPEHPAEKTRADVVVCSDNVIYSSLWLNELRRQGNMGYQQGF
jgi:hypothetical protein